MTMEIIGTFDRDQLFCAGSLTKLLTTFVILSFLSEHYDLETILDDDHFLERTSTQPAAKAFLQLFQRIIGSQFSLHDLCSYYAGLPYTFDVSKKQLDDVDLGHPLKHHSILDEATFLSHCKDNITALYQAKCKFHYSELSIIFLGYWLEKAFNLRIEALYERYLFKQFNLKNSLFSRKLVPNVYCQDLSNQYDYPSIAILNHGYFCYSNGYFTTLNDMKTLLDAMITTSTFNIMTDMRLARAASNTLMNGLTIEIRQVQDDIIYGYEGFSFSGCNIWAYSTKHKKGFITFTNDEEEAYPIIYDQWHYQTFDRAPEHTQTIYKRFMQQPQETISEKAIPSDYQGKYKRVKINDSELENTFIVGDHFIIIRNPDEIKYEVIYANGHYHIKGKDNVPGAKVGFSQSTNGHYYLYHDCTLYKKYS